MAHKQEMENLTCKALVTSLNVSRFALYTLEALPIRALRTLVGITRKRNPEPSKEQLKDIIPDIKKMIAEESENIIRNIYPQNLIYPENPLKHTKRYLEIISDSLRSSLRAKNKIYKEFSSAVKEDLNSLPKYYRRNFHFQTNGYLTQKSAELYTHQTEILFNGTLNLARRLLMAPMLSYIQNKNKTLKILELGCGAGEGTKILLHSCKNLEVTAIDLSDSYLERAKNENKNFSNINFKKCDATQINNEKYDIIFSIYLFHELPENERRQIIKSCHKMLNPGGFMMHIDSLQLNDVPKLNWALLNFPQDFHEPFYTNYIKRPLEKLIREFSYDNIETNYKFLSKSVLAFKN